MLRGQSQAWCGLTPLSEEGAAGGQHLGERVMADLLHVWIVVE